MLLLYKKTEVRTWVRCDCETSEAQFYVCSSLWGGTAKQPRINQIYVQLSAIYRNYGLNIGPQCSCIYLLYSYCSPLVRFQKNERQILRAPLLLHLLTSSATSTTFQGDWESGLFVLSRLILLSNPCLSLIFTKKDAALDWKLAVETSLITTTYDKECGYFILRVCP